MRRCRFSFVIFCLLFYLFFFFVYFQFEEATSPPSFTTSQRDIKPADASLILDTIEEEDSIIITLKAITLNDPVQLVGNPDETEEICVEELIVYYRSTERENLETERAGQFFQRTTSRSTSILRDSYQISGVCFRKQNVGTIALNSDGRSREKSFAFTTVQDAISTPSITPVRFLQEQLSFSYPLDKRTAFIGVSLRINSTDTNNNSISKFVAPHLTLEVNKSPDWKHAIDIEEGSASTLSNESDLLRAIIQGQTEPIAGITVTQTRKREQLFLTIALLGSIGVFIVSLLFIREIGTFLEVAVAILLGLWGVQDILIPDSITGPTFIKFSILALYILLSVVTIFFVIRRIIPFLHRCWNQLHSSRSDTFLSPSRARFERSQRERDRENDQFINHQANHISLSLAIATAVVATLITLYHYLRRRPD